MVTMTKGGPLSFLLMGRNPAREGDHSRSHPALDLGRWRNRLGRASPGRKRAELGAIFVGNPPRLVAALAGDVGEHAVPLATGFRIVGGIACATIGDETELTVSHEHVARWPLRQEAAMRAGFASSRLLKKLGR